MEFAWLFKARRFFPLFVLLYTIHFPFQRSFCQRFHGLACSQSSRCLHYTYGFPWFAEDQKSHGVWFHQGSCPIVICGSRFWWFCSTAYFSALIPWDVFFSDMMSPSLLMVPVLIDADWLILFWWVGIILSWSISSTNDDSDPKLGTVSHYFPLLGIMIQNECIDTFSLSQGGESSNFLGCWTLVATPWWISTCSTRTTPSLAFANNLQERTWVFKLHMWWCVWVQELMLFAVVVNVLFQGPLSR